MKIGDRVKRAEGTIVAETDDYWIVKWDDYIKPQAHNKKDDKVIPVEAREYRPSKVNLPLS